MPTYHSGHSRALGSIEVGSNTLAVKDRHRLEEQVELLQEVAVVVHLVATYGPKSRLQLIPVEYLAHVPPKHEPLLQ
jgi:hypothetical protein